MCCLVRQKVVRKQRMPRDRRKSPRGLCPTAAATLTQSEAVLPGAAEPAAIKASVERLGALALSVGSEAIRPAEARAMATTGRRLRQEARSRKEAAERQADDGEAELERFYRSSAWDDLSFALDWLPCWIAWLDLRDLLRTALRGAKHSTHHAESFAMLCSMCGGPSWLRWRCAA